MKKTTKWLLFFIGIGFILGKSFDFNMNKLYYDKNKLHATAYACNDLKTIGRTYCYDKENPNYMTIGLYENPNDYKAFYRIKDEGAGIPLIVLAKKQNIYNEVWCRIKIKENSYEGWIKENLIKYD
mgnify:CR=1 FL=1